MTNMQLPFRINVNVEKNEKKVKLFPTTKYIHRKCVPTMLDQMKE